MSTPTILSLWGKRKADSEPEVRETGRQKTSSDTTNNKENEPPQSSSPANKRNRDKFDNAWERTFPWIQKIEIDGQVRAVCTWCKDTKRNNAMASSGTPNLQVSTFSRHEKSKEHMWAAQSRQLKKTKSTVPQIVDKPADKDLSTDDPCKDAQLRTVYYLAKNGQPLCQYTNLITLQQKNECPHLQDDSKIYTSETARNEMLDCVNDTIEEGILEDINSSQFLGIIADESTDITIHKKLNVYVKCLSKDKNQPVFHFMDCINVVDGKAETIVNEIRNLLTTKNIPLEKVSSLASDGAAVMTGRHNGVGAKLREDIPHLVQIHCVAHKLALAAGQACRDNTLFNEYQLTLKNIYRYFNNSAVRYNELRALQDLLKSDEDVRQVTLKEPASFRWLSLEAAVKAISDVYPALYMELENAATKGVAEAKGLFTKVKNVTFVLCTAFLRDILGVVNKLSQTFQKNDLDISTVIIMIDSTISKLENFKKSNGKELSKVYEKIEESIYRYVKLVDKQTSRMQFQNSSNDYLDALINNLNSKFDKDSMKILQLLNKVLNPSLVPKNSTIDSHGCDEIKELVEHYGGENGLIDSEQAIEDYFQFKVVLKSLSDKTLTESCVEIVSNYGDMFPDFAVLAKLQLVTPLTSVTCERGFSTHNKIKTKTRNRLNHETVTKLMRIMEEGPELKDYDPKPCVKKFVSKRERRK